VAADASSRPSRGARGSYRRRSGPCAHDEASRAVLRAADRSSLDLLCGGLLSRVVFLAKALERTVLKRADRPLGLAEHLRDLLRGVALDETHRDHVTVLGLEVGESGQQDALFDRQVRFGLDVLLRGGLDEQAVEGEGLLQRAGAGDCAGWAGGVGG